MRSASHALTTDISQRMSQISIELVAESAAAAIQIPSPVSSYPLSPQLQYNFSRDLEKADSYNDTDEDEVESMNTDTGGAGHRGFQKILRLLDFSLSLQTGGIPGEFSRERAVRQRQSVTSVWSAGGASNLDLKRSGMEDHQEWKSQYTESDSTSQGSDSNQTLVCDTCSAANMNLQQNHGQKKLLLIRMCKALVRYGAASHRIVSRRPFSSTFKFRIFSMNNISHVY
jgi:hypothetical protein